MIDSHAHLDFPQFDSDRKQVIENAFQNGLEYIINIGTDLATSRASLQLAYSHEKIYATIGVHPHDAEKCGPNYIKELEEIFAEDRGENSKIVAIGEIGLDYYRNLSPPEIQRRVFREQLELARKLELPIVVHVRESVDDSFMILEQSGVRRGVLHSFPGNVAQAKKALALGFYISFAGPITYPKSSRVEVAGKMPLKRILTETDCPYLAPQAFRGKRNRPEYVHYVIEKLSEIFAPYTYEDIERITSYNAKKLFGLKYDNRPRIVYKIRRSLYINLTNRCSCNCYFCPRRQSGIVSGRYLKLDHEPQAQEILSAIESEKEYDEIVFCGLGEPTMRLQVLMEIAEKLKKQGKKVRLDTNGHGSLINKINVPSKLNGLVDKICVSLNAHDEATYLKICNPDSGPESYLAMKQFIMDCVKLNIPTEISALNIPEVDIAACRKIADGLRAGFRVREFSKDD